MRILRFMGYPINNFSTLERMIMSQALALRELGHEMEVVFDGVRRPEAARAAQDFAPAVKLHFAPPASALLRGPLRAWGYLRAAARLIRAGRYDIVHLYFDPSARLLNQLARLFPGVRFVRTIGSTPVVNTGRPALDALKRRKWCFELAQMRRVVCVGQHIGDLLASYGVPRERIVVVPNATDVERFQRRLPPPPRAADAVLRLGFIGRLNAVKNIELMIEGMACLVAQGERRVHLTIVGDGELREALLARVRRHQLEAYVRFAGQVSDIPALLNRDIDVYVQASHNEGCPAAVIEAMACEVPVLLSDIPGHRQVAEPDRHGSYFAAGEAAAFAAGVRRIQGDYPRFQAMARQAREHIVATYGIHAWIARELDVYRGVMA